MTVGETMALLTAPSGRQLRSGTCLPVGIGGAESNVAIGLARLGVPSTWISRVGDDAFGALVTREIRGEGVRVIAEPDSAAPTGMMVKEHRGGRPWRVRYYRAGSAASRLSPADIDDTAIADADVLHLTGITPALGPEPLRAVEHAIEIAHRSNTLVSFDVNYRATLWSPEQAATVLSRLAATVDLIFAGPEEAALILGWEPQTGVATVEDGENFARGLAKLGPDTVVVKLGALGALGLTADRVRPRPRRKDHRRRRGRSRRRLRRRLPQRTGDRRTDDRLPADGQHPGRRRLPGTRRLGGVAHQGRTEQPDPRRRCPPVSAHSTT